MTLGGIRFDLSNDLPYPRKRCLARIAKFVDNIYTLMTTHQAEEATPARRALKIQRSGIGFRLPDVHVSIDRLLETIDVPEEKEGIDLPRLAEWLQMDIDDLFP